MDLLNRILGRTGRRVQPSRVRGEGGRYMRKVPIKQGGKVVSYIWLESKKNFKASGSRT